MGKCYFISDVHLGAAFCDKAELERRFVAVLERIAEEGADALYLLGDIFDFWYEYKYVIPRGHTRALGALARLRDSGVKICFFPGNHDVWAYSYFEQELGMQVCESPTVLEVDGCRICMAHGDGLGKTDLTFRIIRGIFHSRLLQRLFSTLHPRWAIGFGYAWAAHSRKMKHAPGDHSGYVFRGTREPLYAYADAFGSDYSAKHGGACIDYYIFGHYHTPGRVDIPSGGTMYILGCWVDGGEYAVLEDGKLRLISEALPV